MFETTDPYREGAWSHPVQFNAEYIDPDLFWNHDGTTYVATAGTNLQTINLETSTLGKSRRTWNGTTGTFLEGPHLYKKDGYYYLLTAEGGSGLNHFVTIAGSSNVWGLYESYNRNPVLSNRNTLKCFASRRLLQALWPATRIIQPAMSLLILLWSCVGRRIHCLSIASTINFAPKVRDEKVGVT